MLLWELLDSVKVPGGEEITLHRRGKEFAIKVNGSLLMNSLTHSSEDELAAIACKRLRGVRRASVLIGGLGMGYTLAAALRGLGPDARLAVAEISPAVVGWNRGPIAHLAGSPLKDPRVTVVERDIADILRGQRGAPGGAVLEGAGRPPLAGEGGAYDAILQDVDNGPEGLTIEANDWLYADAGLEVAFAALRPNGILALWSARPNRKFVKRLRRAGFTVDEVPVRGRDRWRGAHHIIYLAARRDFPGGGRPRERSR
ncbi:MAG TPA: spermidine synthase [Elusimicrobia bacterium]|nr:spermidine synthase [Elusimicrobiota bacterium]